jgi:quinol monooxygenase YgiN
MTAFNVVRMKVKPGREDAFLDSQRQEEMRPYEGLRAFHIVATGAREYLFVGEWDSMDALAAARPAMIESLDRFREHLEDLGEGAGVTDPRSGEAVVSRRAE